MIGLRTPLLRYKTADASPPSPKRLQPVRMERDAEWGPLVVNYAHFVFPVVKLFFPIGNWARLMWAPKRPPEPPPPQ